MRPGDLRRWKIPWKMPGFRDSEVFLILRVGDYVVDFLVNSQHVRNWRYDYILENSDPIE